MSDARALIAALTDHHQIGQMNRRFLRQDSPLYVSLRIGQCVLLNEIQALNNGAVFVAEDPQDLSDLAALFSGKNVYLVVLLNMDFGHPIQSSLQLQEFTSQGHNFQKLFFAKLAAHRAEDSSPNGFLLVVDQDGRVIVEANVGAVFSAVLLSSPHHYSLYHISLLDAPVRRGLFYVSGDDIAKTRYESHLVSQRQDARDSPRARVVRYVEYSSHLNHNNPNRFTIDD